MRDTYTLEYTNLDYRWWVPGDWFNRRIVYEHGSMTPIVMDYRRKRLFVTTDSVGHHLVETCANVETIS